MRVTEHPLAAEESVPEGFPYMVHVSQHFIQPRASTKPNS